MFDKAALKRLTQSDLTFFEWQFRNRNAGNQKAINLNASVFVNELYPSLPSIVRGMGDKLPIDLFLNGPGRKPVYNVQRKIIKGNAYKNWRLDGEFVYNPEDDTERFNDLCPGDLALMLFGGDPQPVTLSIYLLSQANPDDNSLYREFNALLEHHPMEAVGIDQVRHAIRAAAPVWEHPINDVLLDEAMEDAAVGGVLGVKTLLRQPRQLRISALDLQKARANAERVGRLGEALVNDFFLTSKKNGVIVDYQWVSNDNAVSPYDFLLTYPENLLVKLDVKCTAGSFERPVHISMSELQEMATASERYDLCRVYFADHDRGLLRICEECRGFALDILSDTAGLHKRGVTIDSISVDPRTFSFGDEIAMEPCDDE